MTLANLTTQDIETSIDLYKLIDTYTEHTQTLDSRLLSQFAPFFRLEKLLTADGLISGFSPVSSQFSPATLIATAVIVASGYTVVSWETQRLNKVFGIAPASLPTLQKNLRDGGAVLMHKEHLKPHFVFTAYEDYGAASADTSLIKLLHSIFIPLTAAGVTDALIELQIGSHQQTHTYQEAQQLAQIIRSIGKQLHIEVVMVITDPVQTNNQIVGTRLEMREVLKVLEQSPDRSRSLEIQAVQIAGTFLHHLHHKSHRHQDGREEAIHQLQTGRALEAFKVLIKRHTGDTEITADTLVPLAESLPITSAQSGRIVVVHNDRLKLIARILGVPDNQHAGIIINKHLNDAVQTGETMLTLFADNQYLLNEAAHTLINIPVYEIKH